MRGISNSVSVKSHKSTSLRSVFWRFIFFPCLDHLYLILHFPILNWYLSIRQSRHLSQSSWTCRIQEKTHTNWSDQSFWGPLAIPPVPREKQVAAVFVHTLCAKSRMGDSYGKYQPKPLSPFFPGCYTWLNASELQEQQRQMLVLQAALEKLGHWMHKSTLYLPKGELKTQIWIH